MKNIKLLRWLTFLRGENLIRALLMIGICAIFTMYISSQNEVKRLRNKFDVQTEDRRQEIIRRTDSFNLIKQTMQDLYARKYEQYLEEQIKKIDRTNKIVNNTIDNNARLLKKMKHAK